MQMYRVPSGSVALAAATLKYVLALGAPSNQDAQLYKVRFSFDGSSASGNNVLVEVCTWTTDGTGTGVTPITFGENRQKTALTTAKKNYTVAPTTGLTVIDSFWLPPNVGPYEYYEPLCQEEEIPESTFYGWRLTSPNINNVAITAFFKE